jgi:hypothetical protein
VNKKAQEPIVDELITVVLKRPHTHAGKIYQTGETLRVNAAMRDWLIVQGVVDE